MLISLWTIFAIGLHTVAIEPHPNENRYSTNKYEFYKQHHFK
ncbi:hypothetical protein H1P_50015 [Hyella patelloides LEGE 07179]|uniref:Uncharacterized protein n=1 Tax=Hyella patelloides LEGE 07179 TaxID=945734 RepID=A0A563VZG5_9CYAN|nr:hypothetical protein H1P_50015 [Hyella patelloides LEGE 07179]